MLWQVNIHVDKPYQGLSNITMWELPNNTDACVSASDGGGDVEFFYSI